MKKCIVLLLLFLTYTSVFARCRATSEVTKLSLYTNPVQIDDEGVWKGHEPLHIFWFYGSFSPTGTILVVPGKTFKDAIQFVNKQGNKIFNGVHDPIFISDQSPQFCLYKGEGDDALDTPGTIADIMWP